MLYLGQLQSRATFGGAKRHKVGVGLAMAKLTEGKSHPFQKLKVRRDGS